MERVKGNKVKEKRSLLEIFHLASVCHVGCHFNSGKQVECLHFQYGFFKNEWSHCPKKSLIGLQHMCRVIVSSCCRAVHDGDGLMHVYTLYYIQAHCTAYCTHTDNVSQTQKNNTTQARVGDIKADILQLQMLKSCRKNRGPFHCPLKHDYENFCNSCCCGQKWQLQLK